MLTGKRLQLQVGAIVGLDQYVSYFKIQLGIQQRIKSAELRMLTEEQENELPNFTPFIPLMSPLVSFLSELFCFYFDDAHTLLLVFNSMLKTLRLYTMICN